MTIFDYLFLAVIVLSAGVGMWRGFVSEIIAIVAWFAALAAAWLYASEVADLLAGVIVEPGWRHVAGFVLIFVGVLVVAALLRFLLRELLRMAGLGSTDRFFGTLLGVLRGVAIALLLVLVGGLLGMASEPWWHDAKFAPVLEDAVIAAKPWLPDAVADRVRFR